MHLPASQNLDKNGGALWCREVRFVYIGCWEVCTSTHPNAPPLIKGGITLKLIEHLSSSLAEIPIKCQSDPTTLNKNLLRSYDKTTSTISQWSAFFRKVLQMRASSKCSASSFTASIVWEKHVLLYHLPDIAMVQVIEILPHGRQGPFYHI